MNKPGKAMVHEAGANPLAGFVPCVTSATPPQAHACPTVSWMMEEAGCFRPLSASSQQHQIQICSLVLISSDQQCLSEGCLEAVDVDSEVYCWRRSEFFWRMRATLGFTQVWRARKPPPCAHRSATLVGHATDIKPPPFPTFV